MWMNEKERTFINPPRNGIGQVVTLFRILKWNQPLSGLKYDLKNTMAQIIKKRLAI